MTHTKTTLTESELKDYLREHMGDRSGFSPSCQSEIQAIQGGAVSSFESGETHPVLNGTSDPETFIATGAPVSIIQPKRRGGWPKGKPRKPK